LVESLDAITRCMAQILCGFVIGTLKDPLRAKLQ